MKFTLKPGSELDLLSAPEFRSEVASVLRVLQQWNQPADFRNIDAYATANSTGRAEVKLEGPPGLLWFIRRLTVCGPNPLTSVAGATVHIFRGSISAPTLVDLATGVPNVAPWEKGALPITGTTPLIGVFQGMTASDVCWMSALVEQVPTFALDLPFLRDGQPKVEDAVS